MRYFTSDTHFGHPLVTALRGFLNNGRLRAEYRDVWQAQGRAAAHTWIKQYVRDNQTSFKAICDITRHENTIIGNHDRNFRLRSNDALYENVFETIDDYREIDMELPVLDGTGKPTAATTRQTIGMSHFPRLSALTEEHGNWPENWNKFADVAPTTEGWLLYGHTHQGIPNGTDPLSVNVGLDAWDFKPVSEQQILAWFTFRHADQSK